MRERGINIWLALRSGMREGDKYLACFKVWDEREGDKYLACFRVWDERGG